MGNEISLEGFLIDDKVAAAGAQKMRATLALRRPVP
jgi:hypothetical protein